MIVALAPAPGHESLVAEGPMGERPALLVLHRGAWVAWPAPAVREHPDSRPRALVIHAPGDPRLGSLRLMDALFGDDADEVAVFAGVSRGRARWPDGQPYAPLRSWPVPGLSKVREPRARDPYALAHLAVQRGLGVEVLALPVPS